MFVWLFFTLLFAVAAVVIFFGMQKHRRHAGASDPAWAGTKSLGRPIYILVKWAALFVLVVPGILMWTTLRMVHTIEAGHVGVVYTFGEITGQRDEGIAVIAPWSSMRDESIQVQSHTFAQVTAFSKETQDVFVTITVNYSVSPRAVQDLFREVGPDWFNRLVDSRAQNFIKEETVQYEAVDIAPNREAIRQNIKAALSDALEPYSVDVVDLLVNNISFSPEFTGAIEDKQIATQEALQAQELVAKSEAEARQAVAKAEGEAEKVVIAANADASKVRIDAQAEADAAKLVADGQAEANRILIASLGGASLLDYLAIQQLADNIEIALIPSGEGLILDPATLLTRDVDVADAGVTDDDVEPVPEG